MGQHSAIFYLNKMCSFLVHSIEKYVHLFSMIKYDLLYFLFFSGKNLCYDNEYLDIDLIAEYLQNDKT